MVTYEKPKTIEELKAFCAEKGMPLERMRFFIGEDCREPRAFGIYRDENGDCVVYKNKDDGSRAVRYQGPDEAYAVNELYEKLKSEVELRRRGAAAAAPDKKKNKAGRAILAVFLALCAALVVVSVSIFARKPKGYYQYQNQTYYYDYNDWYVFSHELNAWTQWRGTADWTEQPKDYYLSSKYDDAYGAEDFKSSDYYHESRDSYDWGSSSSYDSWDSGATNWSSDW
ncbi:MAG: hypothetical protein J1E43_02925 [Christensenellaceae bacterium]|nr:hypothetical protein [Christensenellaceae bacterium]